MRKKNNLVLRLASLLIICVLVSTYALCGLLARYTTSGSSWDDARVIEFNELVINDLTSKAIIVPGVPIKEEVIVDFNGSESSTYVFVEMDLGGTWMRTPSVENKSNDIFSFNSKNRALLSFEIDPQWTYLSQEGTSVVFYQELKPNTPIEAPVIKNNEIMVSPDIITIDVVDGKRTDGELSIFKNLSMKFSAVVVQSNGFESAKAAWIDITK